MTPALTDFIQRTGVAMQAYIPRAAAEVFALLVAADEPLAMDEIACALRHSRAGVTASLRILDSHDVIERIRPAGDRRDRFALREDAFRRLMARIAGRFHELAELAREADFDGPRLHEMTQTFELASARLDFHGRHA